MRRCRAGTKHTSLPPPPKDAPVTMRNLQGWDLYFKINTTMAGNKLAFIFQGFTQVLFLYQSLIYLRM